MRRGREGLLGLFFHSLHDPLRWVLGASASQILGYAVSLGQGFVA